MLRSKRTIASHSKEDYVLIKSKQEKIYSSSQRLHGCSYNPSLYETHVASKTPLYSNAEISILDYIFIEFRKFVSHPSYAKTTVSETFRTDGLFKLPKPNNCPKDFTTAKLAIKDFLVPLITYHVCPKDCVIFTGEYSELEECPKCGEKRFKNRKAAKTFKYFPLSPRIARIYQNENLVKLLQAHSSRQDDGILKDVFDTDRWKKSWFGENGEFKRDTGCALNFCTDGVNPFKTMHLIYSMWPLMTSILNFPISFRKSVGGIMLLGIIPGNGRKEAFHLDPYINLVVEELLILSECHVYYPSYMQAPIEIQAKLLQYVLDFPGISKLLKLPSTGAIKACPWCGVSGHYCKSFRKTVYLDNRRYLENDNVLRSSKDFAWDTNYEDRQTPAALTTEEQTERRNEYDILPNDNRKKAFSREYGVKGSYALMKLPYHRYHEHVQPDGMHTIFDVVEHVIAWLIGQKSEIQLVSGEEELRSAGKRKRSGRTSMLSKDEKVLGNSRCKKLAFPTDYSGFTGDVFDSPKVILKKTHGWTEVFTFLLNYYYQYLILVSIFTCLKIYKC